MREIKSIKPQDILVLLKLFLLDGEEYRQVDIAGELKMSPGEITHSLNRLSAAKLIGLDKRSVLRANAFEFLVHGVKYAFPARLGPIEIGIKTAYSAPPLSKKIKSSEDCVWPYPEGGARGQALYPLYKSVPEVSLNDQELYELLSLIDAIRVGKARERELAKTELEKRILA